MTKMQQQLSFLIALLTLLCSSASSCVTSPRRRGNTISKENLIDGITLETRNLSDKRRQYSAAVYLSWGTDTAMTEEDAAIVAEKAKSYITQNFPESAPDGVVALGVLSVTVVDQTTSTTSSGAFLRVKFLVEGLVIGESTFEEESLDFDVLVNDAIRANDGEYLRLVEPLVVGPEEVLTDQGDDGTTDIVLIVVVVALAIAVVIVLVLIFFAWEKRRTSETSMDDLPVVNKNVPIIALEDASGKRGQADSVAGSAADSVAEQSMYTTAASRKSTNAATILFSDNGQSVCSKFSTWSFSACSDRGGSEVDELGMHGVEDGTQFIGSNIETVHDLDAEGNVFVDIDMQERNLNSEDDGSRSSAASAGFF